MTKRERDCGRRVGGVSDTLLNKGLIPILRNTFLQASLAFSGSILLGGF